MNHTTNTPTYTPDKWVVLKFSNGTYRVLASWYGGYLSGDSWKLNSGITSVEDCDTMLLFHGESGSVYRCYKNSYGMNGFTYGVYEGFCKQDALELLDESTNFTDIKYK